MRLSDGILFPVLDRRITNHHHDVNPNDDHNQAFQNFIDARIQPEAGDLDVVFFDACIAAKRNRSMLQVSKKADAAFLR